MLLSVVTPTHDPRYIPELFEHLKRQTYTNWEWVLSPCDMRVPGQGWTSMPLLGITSHEKVRLRPYPGIPGNVGAAKLWAFSHAKGEVLVELDHDDILLPNALECVAEAFADTAIGFAYSDFYDWSPTGAPVTYHHPERRAAWEADGWKFGITKIRCRIDSPYIDDVVEYPFSPEPSAMALSTILTAPNHLRAWRRSVYREVGGHDPSLVVCDDHDLLCRTYLATKMVRIPEVLYSYRVDGENTWLKNQDAIQAKTFELRTKYLHRLVARECELRGDLMVDLGGGMNPAGVPWMPADVRFPDDVGSNFAYTNPDEQIKSLSRVRFDARGRWPFANSSVGAFRAFDFLEHLTDKLHTMREIYRCLRPGGWLLSQTPFAGGPGAYQDPTHVSYWVGNSFRYHTDRNLAKFLPPDPSDAENPRFMIARLYETEDPIPYVVADLVSLKEDDGSLPGRRSI